MTVLDPTIATYLTEHRDNKEGIMLSLHTPIKKEMIANIVKPDELFTYNTTLSKSLLGIQSRY